MRESMRLVAQDTEPMAMERLPLYPAWESDAGCDAVRGRTAERCACRKKFGAAWRSIKLPGRREERPSNQTFSSTETASHVAEVFTQL